MVNKAERNLHEFQSLNTREVTGKNALQLSENTDQFIYRSTMTKQRSHQVDDNIQDIAPQNAALKREVKAENIRGNALRFMEEQTELPKWGIRIIFDNDIWDNTDYYYTNGLAIEMITPLAKSSPIHKILLGSKAPDIELNGFSIRQNMYTPTNPDVTEILVNDRPFSAFLTLGHFRETFNIEKKLHIKSALDIGVLGPASLGGTIQTSLHTEEPVGWQNQIQNSLVISYDLEIEKGVFQTHRFEVDTKGHAIAGTLFNKIGGGFTIRAGRFLPTYQGPMSTMTTSGKCSPLQFWFFAKGMTDFVLYDATLQGGFFNTTNPYTIPNKDIKRLVFQASAGIAVYSGKLGIELENFFLSPEFKGGRNFGWGRIKLVAVF